MPTTLTLKNVPFAERLARARALRNAPPKTKFRARDIDAMKREGRQLTNAGDCSVSACRYRDRRRRGGIDTCGQAEPDEPSIHGLNTGTRAFMYSAVSRDTTVSP